MNDSYFDKHRAIKHLQSIRKSQKNYPPRHEALLSHILTGAQHTALTLHNEYIYRARWNKEGYLFNHYDELIYPKNCSTEGRFNDIGQSIFYDALCELGTIIELRPKIGKIFTISRFRKHPNKDPFFFRLGIKNGPNQSPYRNKKQKIITDFLNEELINLNDYTLTKLIGKHFFTHPLPFKNNDGKNLYANIVYPSVQSTLISNQTTQNIAMTPNCFDENYFIEGSTCYILTNEAFHYQLNPINEATIHTNGDIQWKHDFEEMKKQMNFIT